MKDRARDRLNARAWLASVGWAYLALVAWLPVQPAGAQANPISLEVRGTPDPAAPGDHVRYTLHVANPNTTTPSGPVMVRANIPQYVTVVERPDSQTASGTRYGSYVEWRFTDIAPGEGFTRHFTVLVDNTAMNPPPPDGTVLNLEVTATASATTFTKSTTSVVRTLPVGLDLNIQGSSGRVAPGATVTYELRFGNTGDSPRQAFLRLPLPAGTSFVSATGGGSESSGAVQWDLGTLPPGASGRRSATVQVSSSAPLSSYVIADAELKPDAAGPALVRSFDAALVAPPSNLSMVLTAAPDPIAPGAKVVGKLFVANRSANIPSGVFNVVIHIPKKATVTARPGSQTASGTRFGSHMVYRFEGLEPGESTVEQFTLQVDNSSTQPPPPNGTLLPIEGYINAQGGTSASTVVNVDAKMALDLALAVEPSALAAGQNLSYRLSFGNAGDTDVASVLKLPVPAGTSFVSATGGGVESDGAVLWTLGTLNRGFADFRSATFRVVDGTADGTLLNAEAELADPTAPSSFVRRASVTTVASSNPLTLAVSAAPEPVVGGSVVIYRMVLTNTSTSVPSEQLDLTVNIPEYATVSERPGSQTASGTRFGDTITYRYASLAPGAVAMNQFTVTIDNTAMNPPPSYGTVIHSDFTAGTVRVDKDVFVGVSGSVGSGEGGTGGQGNPTGGNGSQPGGGTSGPDGGPDRGGSPQGGTSDAGPSDASSGGQAVANDGGVGGVDPGSAGGEDGGCACATAPRATFSSFCSTLFAIGLVYVGRRRGRRRRQCRCPQCDAPPTASSSSPT